MGAGPAGDLGGPVGAPGAASPSDPDGPGRLCPRRALAPSRPNCPAGCWWEGSWARVAHPPAKLASRRAGEPPGRVGDEAAQGRSLDAWVADMADGTAGVSAGPAGPPDPSRMPPAATPDHDARGRRGVPPHLNSSDANTYVPGRPTAPSACLRVAAGSVVDAATPGRAFAELGAAGHATGGAGIKFPARPGPNVRAHGDVVAERPATVREADKLVAHGGRRACAGRSEAELVPGVRGWPCLCVDMQARGQEQHRLFARAGRRGSRRGRSTGGRGGWALLEPGDFNHK